MEFHNFNASIRSFTRNMDAHWHQKNMPRDKIFGISSHGKKYTLTKKLTGKKKYPKNLDVSSRVLGEDILTR